MSYKTGKELGVALLKALSIDATDVWRVSIECTAGSMATVTITCGVRDVVVAEAIDAGEYVVVKRSLAQKSGLLP